MTLVASLNRTWDRDGTASTSKARAAFIELRGESDAVARQALIDALPHVQWKARTLVTLRCNGVTGNGPHDVNVPESLVWSLIEPKAWRCPYHA